MPENCEDGARRSRRLAEGLHACMGNLLPEDVAVVNGRSRYFKDSSRTEPTKEWDNLFVIEFDDDGRCRSFREWYVARRGQAD